MGHRHHWAEKLGTWKDGTKFRLNECKCGVGAFYSAIPNQICKSCNKKIEVNAMIFLTNDYDYFRCKACMAKILGEAFKAELEKDD